MIKLIGNDIIQNGEKIGWIRENDIFNKSGNKIGYYIGDDIYNYKGVKIGYLENNYIKYENGNRKMGLQETKNHIVGGTIPDICRATIKLLLGD